MNSNDLADVCLEVCDKVQADLASAAARAKRMTVHKLAAWPHYHPMLAEIWTYRAEAWEERILACSGSRATPSFARG